MAIFNFQRPKWIPRWINIPLLIFVVFVAILLFVGDNSFMRSTEYRSQINELNTDNEQLEHLVREKYGMKRVNEEVYITDIP